MLNPRSSPCWKTCLASRTAVTKEFESDAPEPGPDHISEIADETNKGMPYQRGNSHRQHPGPTNEPFTTVGVHPPLEPRTYLPGLSWLDRLAHKF